MVFLKLPRIKLIKISEEVKPTAQFFLRNYSKDKSNEAQKSAKPVENDKNDMPVNIKNPFEEEKPQCILCRYDIEPSYKNVRLLSQFTSKFTGKVYGRYITGLCKAKQEAVEREIKRAQTAGLMGFYTKDKNFLADPVLYDSTKPFKVL